MKLNIASDSPYADIPRLRLSYSSTRTLIACPRKFEFSKLFNLVREDDTGHAALIGHLLHETLAIFLRTRDESAALGYLCTRYPIDTFKQYSPNDARSLEACYGTALALFADPLFDRLELSQIEVPGRGIVEAVEVPFEIHLDMRIGMLPLSFIGYIDFICWDSHLQRHVILDLKTTRRNVNHMRAKFKFDEQMLPYSLVLETVLGATFQHVDVTYLLTYIDLLSPHIEPLTYTKTAVDLREWAQSLYVLITELQLYYRHRWFPRRSDACATFSVCQFSSYCESRDSAWLGNYFRKTGMIADEREFEPWVSAHVELQQ